MRCVLLGFLLCILALPAPAAAAGAWTTFLRPYSYTDLLAVGDTVWCATLEAGLLRFTPSSGTFTSSLREPGGLVSNRLSALALDRSQRLWVGTVDAGVSRLEADRTSWGVVNVFDGLPSDTVTVLEAVGDTMWIGTSRGIALWSGREIAGTLPDPTSPSPFASNSITGIVALGDSLWISTRAGVYRGSIAAGLDPLTTVNLGLASLAVGGLASDGATVFALTDSVYAFDRAAGRWVASTGIGKVLRLSDDHGDVLAASRMGIYRWTGTGWTLEASLNSDDGPTLCPPSDDLCGVFAMTRDANGLFYAANHRGVYRQPTSAPPLAPPNLPGNNVLNVELEGERVYVTTFEEGVGRFDGDRWRIWPVASSNSDTTFRRPVFAFGMVIDHSGRKWLGCWNWALERFDDSISPPSFTHLWDVAQPLALDDTVASHTFAWGAAVDLNGHVWLGNHSPRETILPDIGLDRYDANGDFVANYRPGTSPLRGGRINALTVDRRNEVWVGYSGRGGIGHFPANLDPFALVHLSGTENDDVRGIAAHDTSVWVLTTSELRRYTLGGALRERFTVPASPAELALRPLEIGPDGTAWVGTVNGMRAYRSNGTREDFTRANSPLPSDEVRSIRVDRTSGVVWIGTADGLSRFDPAFVPVAPSVPRLDLRIFPNPARINLVSLGLRLTGNSVDYQGRIFDLTGRLVHRFSAAANGQVIWDGRDLRSRRVEPGIYFVLVQAGGRTGSARVVLIR